MAKQLRIGARCLGHARDDGYTLIESMAAAAILMVVAAGVITALIATAGWFASANTRAAATAVAAQEMAWIRSRGYADIIPSSKTVDAPGGHFSVETSIASVLDTDTQLPMKRISVAVSTLGMTSPVFMVNYAIENTGSPETVYTPYVDVYCKPNSQYVAGTLAGTPVQLRNINDINQISYTALTGYQGDPSRAHFDAVREGQYWLTVDPTYPVVHAYTFPQRVIPTRNSRNEWDLTVTAPDLSGANQAYLRVGAFRAGGWYFDSIGFKPPTTLEPVEGLVITAYPQLHSSGLSQFPTQKQLNSTYSGVVNAYGIACIKIPWTLSARAVDNQSWLVTASTSTGKLSLETNFTGMFIAGDKWTTLEQKPEDPSTVDANDRTTDHIPQFRYVTGTPTNP